MNIAMTERKPAAAQSLKDKVSLVTGSTSGIGLGIARALAGAGSAVVLNGFGKPEEIEAARDGVAKDFGVHGRLFRRRHVEPGLDRRDDRDDARRVRPARRPGQQCRHPARGAACRSFRSAKWDAILAINL